MTEQQLGQLKPKEREMWERAQAATKGPLIVRPCEHDDWGFVRDAAGELVLCCGTSSLCNDFDRNKPWELVKAGPPQVAANAAFFAAAREDVPALLCTIAELRERVRELEAGIRAILSDLNDALRSRQIVAALTSGGQPQ